MGKNRWRRAGTPDASDNFQLTSGFGNLSTDSGSTFVATYTDDDEPATGYKWAVTAEMQSEKVLLPLRLTGRHQLI